MNFREFLQSPPLSSPGLRGCLAMLGQGEGKITPLKGAVGCQHSSARAGVAVFGRAEAPGAGRIRAGRVCLQQAAVPARRWAGTAFPGQLGCVREHQAVSSSFPSLYRDSHPCNSPMASQFTQMLPRFCITEVLFLFK